MYQKNSDAKKRKFLKKTIDRHIPSDNKHGGNSRGAMSRDCETDRESAAGYLFVRVGVATIRSGGLYFRWDGDERPVFA
jgi:hypothetical protein